MGKRKLILLFIASIITTFILGFIGNYVKMENARRNFQIAVRNNQVRPAMGIIRVGPFSGEFTPSETQLVEQAK